MSTPKQKEILNELYDSALVTLGVFTLSMISKKVMRERITASESLKDFAKLTVGITLSQMAVKYAQDKKWIPDDPFKST